MKNLLHQPFILYVGVVKITFLLAFTGFFLHPTDMYAKDFVLINKIMYDTPLNEQIATSQPYSNGEFVELYNAGVDAVNLSGWTMRGGGTTEIYSFPTNTIMNPKSFLIIAYQYYNTGFTLAQLYSGLAANTNNQIVYQRKIILSNSGEKLYLRDNYGATKDSIYYDGTSSKTKPNRLSADNADDISGSSCVCLQRKTAVFANDGSAITNNLDWCTAIVNPFQLYSSFIPSVLPGVGVRYTYDLAGNRTSRTLYTLIISPSQTKRQNQDIIPNVQEKIGDLTITVYPNPTHGALAVRIKGADLSENTTITVYSSDGKQLINLKAVDEITTIDMSNHSAGWYILQIAAGDQHAEFKLIKQ